MIDPTVLYRTLEQLQVDVAERLALEADVTRFALTAWLGPAFNTGGKLHFQLEVDVARYPNNKSEKAEGVNIVELVDEIIHRVQFQRRQITTALSAPIVENGESDGCA